MPIALFPSKTKQPAIELAATIQKFFSKNNIITLAEDDIAEKINAQPISKHKPSKINFFITIGGDGTILRLIHKYPHWNIPILGINLGHLGFMADIPQDDIFPSLQGLIDGSFNIEKRLMLEIKTANEIYYSANDLVLHRGKNHSLIETAIYVNNSYLNNFVADGMIISTPNGSTAYSLAAGGPILSPDLDACVITPICPHTISNRPLVLSGNKEIKIQYLSNYDNPAEAHVDGTNHFDVQTENVITIKKSNRSFKLVNLSRREYFATLRSKLGWTGKLF